MTYGRVENWLQRGVGVDQKMMNADAGCCCVDIYITTT